MSSTSPFELEASNVSLVFLPAIIGPFNFVHRKLLERARSTGEAEILHYPLSCFEANISLYIDNIFLVDYTATPCDFRPSDAPCHQIMMFNGSMMIPTNLFTSSQFIVTVKLMHKIADHDATVVAVGSKRHIIGKQIFPLFSSNRNETAGIIMCDILRLLTPSFSLPLFTRAPSPAPDFQQSISYDTLPQVDQKEQNQYMMTSDLYHVSGSIVDTFAVLLNGPDAEAPEPPIQIESIPDTRLFKAAYMPRKVEIPELKLMINRPFIAGFNISEVSKYKKFFSTFQSGILKLACIQNYDIEEIPKRPLSTPLALFLLNSFRFPDIIGNSNIVKYAEKSVSEMSPQDACRYVSIIVQNARDSPKTVDIMFNIAKKSPEFAVLMYFALKVEFENSQNKTFKSIFEKWKKENSPYFQEAELAEIELDQLKKIVIGVKSVSGKEAKINYVKNQIKNFQFIQPFRLPLCPSFIVHSISTENIIVFGSSLQPVKLDFLDVNGNIYSVILKVGDDMRQDALAVMAISFIDDNLKRFNIDMCLTHYAVLPITREYGLMQFVVGAKAISKVLQVTNNLIQNFFSKDEEEEKCRDRFIKSSAAYTVISYVLGVGDRHLDNLLMKSNGDFFHVDYGFMFGQDPKPLPCSVRVVGEMVSAFDHIDTKSGSTTPTSQKGYYTFLRHCAVIFNAIRRKADEFCCLIALMATAELPHLPKKDVAISNILMDRLHLDLTEKDAGKKIISEIEKSVKALLPKIYEWLHQKRNVFA